jgi:23S rRNA (uracil1939-C5)-methyltransferase
VRRLIDVGELVTILKLVPGGQGMGRLVDGRPVFTTGAFPGDVIFVKNGEDRRSFVEAREYSIETKSPARVAPKCADCASCGGCDWMWISKAEQLRGKAEMIAQCLERIGKIDFKGPISVHPSPEEFSYRSRVRLQVLAGRVGFFARGSHELVEVKECSVSSSELWDLVGAVRKVVSIAPSAFSEVNYVEARVFAGARPLKERASVYFALFQRPGAKARVSSALRAATRELRERALVAFSSEEAGIQAFVPSPGVEVGAPVGGFTQVNEGVNQMLVERVLAEVREVGARSFLDLYCGSGNFSLPLLLAGLSGVGVESSVSAISAARAQATKLGLPGKFVAEACATYLKRESPQRGSFDVVLVDPPRAGAKDCLGPLQRLRAPLLLMIACDPASLGRDLGELVRGGYRLRSIEGFDMFPQTHHVETLAILELDETARLSPPAS